MTQSIVVGLDESPSSRAALAWAARHATLTRSVVRAVHVLDWPYGLDQVEFALLETVGLLLTHDEIDPRPDWLIQFAQGEPGRVLVRQARNAQLLVVGTREHVGLGRLLAGSISHYCLSHAPCPVVAVPAASPLAQQRRRYAASTSVGETST